PDAETLTASDNCGNANVTFNEVRTDGSCPSSYVLARTWTATDECNNTTVHTQNVTVQDTTAPTFVEALPADITVECDVVPDAETLTASDNCGNANVTFNEVRTDGSCPSSYVLARTWTATDECNNTTVHTQNVTVQDTTAPTFVEALPADITVECDIVPDAETLTASDNCGNANVTFNEVRTDGSCPSSYVLARTWTATDECNNTTVHTQNVTVQDTTAPTFVEALPADITVECDIVPDAETLTASDNCGNANVTFNEVRTDGSCPSSYVLARTWTATDECNNTTVHTQNLTVQDTTAPELITSLQTELNVSCADIPEPPTPGFADNCSENVTVVFNEISTFDGTENDYEIIREWSVTDECGNTSVFTQTLFVTMDAIVTQVSDSRCIDDGVIDLTAYVSGDTDSGEWTVVSGDATVSSDGMFDPANGELGDYIFSYSVIENACISTTEITMNINDECVVLPCGQEDVVISKAVTPNGDQWNEYFEITGIELCGFEIDIKIFNRWGALIYESHNYQNDWNGTAHSSSFGNADKVPAGTYYYIVNLKNSGLNPFTGPIYLGTK
ncbi:gliding motility-associated C-terminal domain-containing protein, partial [Yeosuana sp. MJ-SS3]